jgi:hypothetical protein
MLLTPSSYPYTHHETKHGTTQNPWYAQFLKALFKFSKLKGFSSAKLKVIHGYVQSANTVRENTGPLRRLLEERGYKLVYVDGPVMRSLSGSRPWWILGRNLEIDNSTDRWQDSVRVDSSSQ